MAASGVSSSSSAQLPFIYATMTPSVAKYKLRSELKKRRADAKKHGTELPTSQWMLRESSQKGCITITTFKIEMVDGQLKEFAQDRRFGLVKSAEGKMELKNLSKVEDLNKAKESKNLIYLTLSNAYDSEEKIQLMQDLIKNIEAHLGLTQDSYLKPSRQEQSRNDEYDSLMHPSISMEEEPALSPALQAKLEPFFNVKNEPLCSITAEPLTGWHAAILPSGNIVRTDALLKYVRSCKGGAVTDPFTRVPMGPESIMHTEVFIKRQERIERLKEAVKP